MSNRELQIEHKVTDQKRVAVMAIINITPDSFYGESRTFSAHEIEARVALAVEDGATILDVGGYSSRPMADNISEKEEIKRLDRAMQIIRKQFPDVTVSLDTFRSEVARNIIENYGHCIINDITAGNADPKIIDLAAKYKTPYIAMHMRGTPQNMQQLTDYSDITTDVKSYFTEKLEFLHSAGVEQVIIDPGFGFAKTLEQNYELLGGLNQLCELGAEVLAGISRKSMIYKALNTTPEEALIGTTALHWECMRQGATTLRVHDVKEAVEAAKLFELFTKNAIK